MRNLRAIFLPLCCYFTLSSVFVPVVESEIRRPSKNEKLYVRTFRASERGIDPETVRMEDAQLASLELSGQADSELEDPIVLVKVQVRRPKRRSSAAARRMRAGDRKRSGLEISRNYAPTYSKCLALTDLEAAHSCPIPRVPGGVLAAYGKRLRPFIKHRFYCALDSNLRTSHSMTFDGWDENQYCQWYPNFYSTIRESLYLGYIQRRMLRNAGPRVFSIQAYVNRRYQISSDCHGPTRNSASNCYRARYDYFMALPYPRFNPPLSNSDCWFKKFTSYLVGVAPPVLSPCWGD